MMDPLVARVYEEILRTANRFLTHGQKYPIALLEKEDPSYEDVANLIEEARRLIHRALDDYDPMIAQQAYDYCSLMLKIALAIRAGDAPALESFCAELAAKPFVMPQ